MSIRSLSRVEAEKMTGKYYGVELILKIDWSLMKNDTYVS